MISWRDIVSSLVSWSTWSELLPSSPPSLAQFGSPRKSRWAAPGSRQVNFLELTRRCEIFLARFEWLSQRRHYSPTLAQELQLEKDRAQHDFTTRRCEKIKMMIKRHEKQIQNQEHNKEEQTEKEENEEKEEKTTENG